LRDEPKTCILTFDTEIRVSSTEVGAILDSQLRGHRALSIESSSRGIGVLAVERLNSAIDVVPVRERRRGGCVRGKGGWETRCSRARSSVVLLALLRPRSISERTDKDSFFHCHHKPR
jgi:hypothetical protein